MRVCHVVRQFHPSVGGLETFVDLLARNLNEQNCECDVLTLDRVFTQDRALAREEWVTGLRVRRVPMVGHRRFFLPLIRREDLASYDVIHVHGIDGMFDRVARQPRGREQVLAATSHGLFFHTKWLMPVKRAYFGAVTRLTSRAYDVLLANSAADLHLLQRLGDHAVQLPNGVAPLGDFRASGRDLLFLGRLAKHKHVERVIAALADPGLSDLRLHVVGPEWDVSRLSLAKVAEAHGVAHRVLLHGHVGSQRLAEIARSCGAFVSASTYEGFGMSLIEAMSIGLVPIVEGNASFLELIEAAGIGATTNFAKPKLAAREIRHQLDAASETTQKRAMRFAKRFSWQAHAAETLRVYRDAQERRAHAL